VEVSALYGLLRFNLGTGERGRRAAPRRRAGTVAGPREPAGSGAMARKWEGVIDRSPMHILDMLGAARSLLSRTTCERLVLKAAIGTGEASSTGISAGLAWEAVGAAMAFARESVGKWRCSRSSKPALTSTWIAYWPCASAMLLSPFSRRCGGVEEGVRDWESTLFKA